MPAKPQPIFPTLTPSLQISFSQRLAILRGEYLAEALSRAVDQCDLEQLDGELRKLVPLKTLRRLASTGLRGELFFPVPLLLRTAPRLLGYYRLFMGFSQKEFYNKGPFGRFRRLEEDGIVLEPLADLLFPLCMSLIASAAQLVDSMQQPSPTTLHDLQLLTLGAQLRGSKLNQLGQDATKAVFDLLKEIARGPTTQVTARRISITRAFLFRL
ncbi:MAG: XcyI family restriction endonuclease [Planctomycetes bacterium]|nr:XcyI family restriction endonuclease [Planctomycetota bacterium]